MQAYCVKCKAKKEMKNAKAITMKNRLKVFRAMHDLTQEELAGKLGVTRQTVVSLEIGKYDPSIDLAFRIARLFNIRIEDVFEYEGSPGEFHSLPPASQNSPST